MLEWGQFISQLWSHGSSCSSSLRILVTCQSKLWYVPNLASNNCCSCYTNPHWYIHIYIYFLFLYTTGANCQLYPWWVVRSQRSIMKCWYWSFDVCLLRTHFREITKIPVLCENPHWCLEALWACPSPCLLSGLWFIRNSNEYTRPVLKTVRKYPRWGIGEVNYCSFFLHFGQYTFENTQSTCNSIIFWSKGSWHAWWHLSRVQKLWIGLSLVSLHIGRGLRVVLQNHLKQDVWKSLSNDKNMELRFWWVEWPLVVTLLYLLP